MSDADANHGGDASHGGDADAHGAEPTDADDAPSPVEAAMEDAINMTVSGLYALVGIAVGVAWWQLVGGISLWIAAFGCVTLIFGLPGLAKYLASRRWSTTEAVVRESEVLTKTEAAQRYLGQAARNSQGGYVPLVHYEYTVDGETYESARVSPFDGAISRYRWASSIVDDYPRNKYVTARYDPDDPSRAYLRSWVPTSVFLVWLVATPAFFGAAAWFAAGMPGGAPVVAFAVGVPTVLLGIRQFRRALASRRWPTTAGEITGTDVKSSSSGESGTTSYSPKLRYEYTVDGETYVSSRYRFGSVPSFSSRSKAESWLEDNFPVGSEVPVHYSPDRPDLTVLKPGGLRPLFLVLFGLLWLGLGAFMVLRPGTWTQLAGSF